MESYGGVGRDSGYATLYQPTLVVISTTGPSGKARPSSYRTADFNKNRNFYRKIRVH
jgi:hypothetical protein